MKNLVSKNPVQRFKQGRKIEKFQGGGEPWAGYYTVGNWPKSKLNESKSSKKNFVKSQAEYNKKVKTYVSPYGIFPNRSASSFEFDLINNDFSPWNNHSALVEDLALNSAVYPTRIPNIQKSSIQIPIVNSSHTSQKQPKVNISKQTTTIKNSSNNKKGNSFKSAFDQARNSRLQEFTWNGKRFNTMKAGETKEQWLAGLKPQTTTSPTITFEKPTSVLYTPKPIDNIKIENIPAQTGTYDRTQVRDYIRSKGFNPYSFNGAQRRALRMVLNGTANENDKILAKEMGILKQGGSLLPSRNPVKRFKLQRKGL